MLHSQSFTQDNFPWLHTGRRAEKHATRVSIDSPSLWDCGTPREKPSRRCEGWWPQRAAGTPHGPSGQGLAARAHPTAPARSRQPGRRHRGSPSPRERAPPSAHGWARAGLWELGTSPTGMSLGQGLTVAEFKWDCSVWIEGYGRTHKDRSWYYKHPSEHSSAVNFLVEPDVFCH